MEKKNSGTFVSEFFDGGMNSGRWDCCGNDQASSAMALVISR